MESVWESDQIGHCNVMFTMRKLNVNDKTFILYAWHLLGAICLEKWINDPLIQVMREIDTQTNELWWSNWSSHWVTD